MYKLTKAVSLPFKKGKLQDYKAGNYELPELDTEHWYVKSLIKQGILSDIPKLQIKVQPKKEIINPEKQVETIIIKGPEVPSSMQVLKTKHPDIVEIKPVKVPEKTEDVQKKDIGTTSEQKTETQTPRRRR